LLRHKTPRNDQDWHSQLDMTTATGSGFLLRTKVWG
jgi:hypothetical protein